MWRGRLSQPECEGPLTWGSESRQHLPRQGLRRVRATKLPAASTLGTHLLRRPHRKVNLDNNYMILDLLTVIITRQEPLNPE